MALRLRFPEKAARGKTTPCRHDHPLPAGKNRGPALAVDADAKRESEFSFGDRGQTYYRTDAGTDEGRGFHGYDHGCLV